MLGNVLKKNHSMIDRDSMIEMLRQWGNWQRSAKKANLNYVSSQFETPLEKQRNVTPIYKDSIAEKLDLLMLAYLPKEYIICLELTYVERLINSVAASVLNCSVKTYTIKRNEAISALRGIYAVVTKHNL